MEIPHLPDNTSPETLQPQPTFSTTTLNQGRGVISTLPQISEDLEESLNSHSDVIDLSFSFELGEDKNRIQVPLPEKRYGQLLRHARYTFLNVYRRLFMIVFTLNTVGAAVLFCCRKYPDLSTNLLNDLATATAANVMVAILIRQDYIVNSLFKLCWMVPLHSRLRFRRILAKLYELGGVHSGAGLCAMVWFAIFTGILTKDFVSGQTAQPAIMLMAYIIIMLFCALVIFAYPAFGFMSHNTFENVHRWGGWFVLALFWILLGLFTESLAHISGQDTSVGAVFVYLIKLPAFWFALVSTVHAILPWLRLHKLHVVPGKLSNHAIRLHLQEPVPLFAGLRISDALLKEWHSFASIPARDGKGGSVLVSNAGDWTKRTITHPKPYYWVKGIPITGVLCMARIFKKVVIVTTGSGIGPVLAVVQDLPLQGQCRVIWSTPSPLVTYGCDIISMVTKIDLLSIAYDLYVQEQAEAVFCISNPKLTRKVVYGLKSRGVLAFGPIWDSWSLLGKKKREGSPYRN